MRRVVGGVVLVAALGCTGALDDGESRGPDDPHPLLDPPPTLSVAPVPFEQFVAEASLECQHGDERWTWNPDGTFEIATPRFKQVGSWRTREGDLVHLTKMAMEIGAECLHGRVLDTPSGRWVLCADRPLACPGRVDGAIELRDAGGGPAAIRNVAAVLERLDEGERVTFVGHDADSDGFEVRYRPGEPPLPRRAVTAERIATLLERDLDIAPPAVIADPEAPSLWVVTVATDAVPRVP